MKLGRTGALPAAALIGALALATTNAHAADVLPSRNDDKVKQAHGFPIYPVNKLLTELLTESMPHSVTQDMSLGDNEERRTRTLSVQEERLTSHIGSGSSE